MSKYTTEVRFICEVNAGMSESKGYADVDTILTTASHKIFSFDFPIFDESYRLPLEKKILKHFYTREISEESVGLWKLRLDMKMNEIMPYYNKLYESELLEFNPLYSESLERKKKGDVESNRSENENVKESSKGNGNVSSFGKDTGHVGYNYDGTDLYSDTPQGALSGVESETYLTNARKTNNTGSNDSSNESIGNVTNSEDKTVDRSRGNVNVANTTEDYLESVSGYAGVSASDLLLKFRKTFLNIDMMIIDELEVLFFQLW